MEKVDGPGLKHFILRLPWAIVRFLGRLVRGFLLALGVLAALAILGYVGFEYIVETVDSRYSKQIDAHLGIDKKTISRLRDPAYFAEQSLIVSEDQKTVACISSPEHRILINDPANIPTFFTNAILASEDKNFFTHEGIDKAAIVRAMAKRLLQESRSGASTLTMQIAKHLRDGTGRQTTEKEKIGDIIMALRIEREFSRQELLLKYVNMPYFGRGAYGIEAASNAFGNLRRISRHQAAFLVSLINKPALPIVRLQRIRCQGTRRNSGCELGEAVRGATRVLGLMLDQDMMTDVEYARAANLVERSLRKEIMHPAQRGTNDHFLSACASSGSLPAHKGGLTISITRDDGLQDVLAKAVDLTLRTYWRHRTTPTTTSCARSVRGRLHGDVLAEVGNVNF
jgi:membrane peptidoglycan carboxypeptidase